MGDDVTVGWTYDSLGRQVEESLQIGSTGSTGSTNYSGPQRSSLVYPNARQVNFAYHAGGALHTVADQGASTIATYDYIGSRPLRRAVANGVNLDLRNGSATHYDASGQPECYRHVSGATTVVGFEYGYDAAGNKLWRRSEHDSRDSQRFAYDSSARLVSYVRGDFAETADPVSDCCAAPVVPRGCGNGGLGALYWEGQSQACICDCPIEANQN